MRKLSVEELCRMDTETFRRSSKLPLAVVLDNVRSLHNVGSVFRTADAFRLSVICLSAFGRDTQDGARGGGFGRVEIF